MPGDNYLLGGGLFPDIRHQTFEIKTYWQGYHN